MNRGDTQHTRAERRRERGQRAMARYRRTVLEDEHREREERLAVQTGFRPNAYQAAIFDWIVLGGGGHAVCEAVAGSGKSTTLVEAARRIDRPGLFLAFNKSIATELGARLKGTSMQASTIHALGFGALRRHFGRVKVDSRKYRVILKELWEQDRPVSDEERKALKEEGRPDLRRLVDLARASLVEDRAGVLEVMRHHALEIHPDLERLAADLTLQAMSIGCRELRSVVDYGDMIWAPPALRLPVDRYPWVFVDEAQDLSPAQLATTLRAVETGGRVLAVGDRRQAIYGFAGADSRSFERIIEHLNAKVLPLSVCYRCPTSHLDLAREYCPQIEARPGAPEGEVVTWRRAQAIKRLRTGDLVVCRMTAPLLRLAYELIGAGVPATVKGRDIGRGLCKIATDIGKIRGWDGFGESIDWWEAEQVEALQRAGGDRDSQIEAVSDKAECLRTILVASRARSLSAFTAAIEDLFASDRPSVELSTIHRAKGLQNDRVAVLQPELFDRVRARQEWQQEQERNLQYVAYTRATSVLAFIEGESE